MRLPSTPEMDNLKNIFDNYIKRGKNGDYIPDDAPLEVKNAYKKWHELRQRQINEEMADWWN